MYLRLLASQVLIRDYKLVTPKFAHVGNQVKLDFTLKIHLLDIRISGALFY